MYTFNYGSFSFDWIFEVANIKTHTITVEKDKLVLLKGKKLPHIELEKLIQKKARWIRSKIQSMKSISTDDIVSGSRLNYLGRTYMVIIEFSDTEKEAIVTFNARKFSIVVNRKDSTNQEIILKGIQEFQRRIALEKIYPRIKKWIKITGLEVSGYRIKRMESKWGNCTPDGLVEINPKCIELSNKAIDYVIVHELCHTVELNHTKEFWKLVEQHYPEWKECHNKLDGEV